MTEEWRERIITNLDVVAYALPPSAANWSHAMLAEVPLHSSSWEFLCWIAGVARVMIRESLREKFAVERPLGLSLPCLWLAAFSGYLFAHTIIQMRQSHESWALAWFPFVVCLTMTLIPSVIAFGLWTCDNMARWLAAAFALLDLAVASRYLLVLGTSPFRISKIAADVAIITLMLSPAVREACRCPKGDHSLMITG